MRKRTGNIGMSEEERQKRRSSLGGSDAKIIMSGDQKAIEKLWREKRGEDEPVDLTDVIIVQLGNLTEDFNIDLFEGDTGFVVTDEQRKVVHEDLDFIHSTLDGLVREEEESEVLGVLEAKFMMPFYWSLEKAMEKYWPQVQHNMLVNQMDRSWLSVLTGAANYVNVMIEADPFYQSALLEAEQDFWECVQSGKTPGNPTIAIDAPDISEMRVADMSMNNQWVDLATKMIESKAAADEYKKSEKEIKKLIPEDAKEANGRGVKIARSKDNKLRVTLDKEKVKEHAERVKTALLEAA